MIHINAKRIKKASGTSKDRVRRDRELANRRTPDTQDVATSPDVPYEDLTKDKRGVAISQANPWAKNKRTDKYGFWTDFVSSNIAGIDYDSRKKQLWVKFHSGAVYTYFDVPPNIAQGFYSTSSKGHYFWKHIRNNKHIKYQKLYANRHWTMIPGGIDLSMFALYELNHKERSV